MLPARVTGLVAPACGAEISPTAMPFRTAASSASQESLANRSGGTTKVQAMEQNGRFRNSPSPPSRMSIIATAARTLSPSTKLLQMCLVVPCMQAYVVFRSIEAQVGMSRATTDRQ